MKILFLLTTFILLFSVNGMPQTSCKVHTEAEGRFSYCRIEGWLMMDVTGTSFKAWTSNSSPIDNYFAVRKLPILISRSDGKVTLDEIMAFYVKNSLNAGPSFADGGMTLLKWTDFKNENNVIGGKLVYERKHSAKRMRLVEYWVDRSSYLLIFSFNGLEGSKDINEPKFEAMMKSLNVF